jgi:hypothetical protein
MLSAVQLTQGLLNMDQYCGTCGVFESLMVSAQRTGPFFFVIIDYVIAIYFKCLIYNHLNLLELLYILWCTHME